MRQHDNPQFQLGQIDIASIEFDLTSRDEIPKMLMGLQHIFVTPELKNSVFTLLESALPANVDRQNGRPGMNLWRILVLGTLRLCGNLDYDKLQELANNHHRLRQMLGHSLWGEQAHYSLQTIKDNVALLTPEILQDISRVVVAAGHQALGAETVELEGRCDSFVVQTDVHFPTDITLLFDVMRRVIMLVVPLCLLLGWSTWRQFRHHLRTLKYALRGVQKVKRSRAKNREEQIPQAHREYLATVMGFVERIAQTLEAIPAEVPLSPELVGLVQHITIYLDYAQHQIQLIQRRVLQGETIPHAEKVHSFFEPHTEWLVKGKANVPVELGLPVVILEDQFGFLLQHEVMRHTRDVQVVQPFIQAAKTHFPHLTGCSFDKGFWSPDNHQQLQASLERVILPKKGKLSETEQQRQSAADFVAARYQHAAVESAIHALDNHGLDRCPDHGLPAFQRYVALAMLARNLQILGHLLQQKALRARQRQQRAA